MPQLNTSTTNTLDNQSLGAARTCTLGWPPQPGLHRTFLAFTPNPISQNPSVLENGPLECSYLFSGSSRAELLWTDARLSAFAPDLTSPCLFSRHATNQPLVVLLAFPFLLDDTTREAAPQAGMGWPTVLWLPTMPGLVTHAAGLQRRRTGRTEATRRGEQTWFWQRDINLCFCISRPGGIPHPTGLFQEYYVKGLKNQKRKRWNLVWFCKSKSEYLWYTNISVIGTQMTEVWSHVFYWFVYLYVYIYFLPHKSVIYSFIYFIHIYWTLILCLMVQECQVFEIKYHLVWFSQCLWGKHQILSLFTNEGIIRYSNHQWQVTQGLCLLTQIQ